MSLALSADMRFSVPDYTNDQSWELDLVSGSPPALSLRTTYGLRARSLRIFYRFTEAGKSIIDPASFHRPARMTRFYPNFVTIDFVPIEGLEIIAEFWAPESNVVAGRLALANQTTFPRHLDFELCGVLNPLEGKAFGLSTKHQMIHVLSGATGGLEPVLFMTGGPQQGAGPHPSLGVGLDFEAGTSRSLTWACAAASTQSASFDIARRTATRNWDAERARIQVVDSQQIVEIHTTDSDWDAALALSQKAAIGAFFLNPEHLPKPSFVQARSTETGFSRKGDGSDYSTSWAGQSPLESHFVASLLPGAPDLRRGLIQNFLSVQDPDGRIDARPGLGGQRTHFLAAPLVGSLAWDYFQETGDQSFLVDAYPKLLAFLETWFRSDRDPDGDGVPEWEHVLQTGFEDNPLFDVWSAWSQSVNIQTLLNPHLESLLCREGSVLVSMAEKLGRTEDAAAIRRRLPALTTSLAESWKERLGCYSYRDRLTGASWTHRLVASRRGSGEILPRRPECEQPVRLLLHVHSAAAATARPTVEIFGRSSPRKQSGAPTKSSRRAHRPAEDRPLSERIPPTQFQWRTGGLVAISELIYGKVERVTVEGLGAKDRLVVSTLDTTGEDITLFAPLWSRVPHPDHAAAMARRLLTEEGGFNRPFGIPALPASPSAAGQGTREQAEAEALAMSVHMPWNNLIGEGLLAYGLREEAADLTTRLMKVVIASLKRDSAFYERYHAVTGTGHGERRSVLGLAPVGLFLKALGVQILSPHSVRLEGRNPFLWPVTVIYRGMKVTRGHEATEVTFYPARTITVTDPAPCVVNA